MFTPYAEGECSFSPQNRNQASKVSLTFQGFCLHPRGSAFTQEWREGRVGEDE